MAAVNIKYYGIKFYIFVPTNDIDVLGRTLWLSIRNSDFDPNRPYERPKEYTYFWYTIPKMLSLAIFILVLTVNSGVNGNCVGAFGGPGKFHHRVG